MKVNRFKTDNSFSTMLSRSIVLLVVDSVVLFDINICRRNFTFKHFSLVAGPQIFYKVNLIFNLLIIVMFYYHGFNVFNTPLE